MTELWYAARTAWPPALAAGKRHRPLCPTTAEIKSGPSTTPAAALSSPGRFHDDLLVELADVLTEKSIENADQCSEMLHGTQY